MGSVNRQRQKDAKLLKLILRAIDKQCLECAGGNLLERKFCSCCECALWSYRFGRVPDRVNPVLLDKKNFAEGAVFGFDKEAVKSENAFKTTEKRQGSPVFAAQGKGLPC